uniref:Uncharacterized protein n=1 Tax=Timema poppense TaxID=170557 RepID=A0A7R9H084_TIMPO|nr:unnamed protein product [Timema poppensis]
MTLVWPTACPTAHVALRANTVVAVVATINHVETLHRYKPVRHVVKHWVPCSSSGDSQEMQLYSVGPVQVSQNHPSRSDCSRKERSLRSCQVSTPLRRLYSRYCCKCCSLADTRGTLSSSCARSSLVGTPLDNHR